MKDGLGELYINNNFVYNMNFSHSQNELKGVHYAFQGEGQIDGVSFKKIDGTIIFDDTF